MLEPTNLVRSWRAEAVSQESVPGRYQLSPWLCSLHDPQVSAGFVDGFCLAIEGQELL